ncbi:NAD-dependent epimerase/dehydratase family protein [Seohaeicola zhoushanensis]|uniref:Nucleoside-diphosphate sugar epimerase n=1 Tax=Seohaeicola zhoushanensis TaxID=1569283 RepID=A0A8J3GX17_9RHOB|nr:NAD(P)-dependent oxidoreductase [Seohaeicola zhoushanensis]GHF46242.1 nucleoside-diphosphate sugar epimerase [Seohaeicola zhoushanensis]
MTALPFKPAAPLGPVLVTGGSGFLGRALVRALVELGESVVVFDLRAPAPEARIAGAAYVEGDIRQQQDLHRVAADHGVASIVHLAALVIPACRANPVLGAEVNVIGHLNALDVARALGISRFVYTSSLAARPRGPLNSPANLYGVYKAACEDISKVHFLDHGLASIGLRPNVVYGPERVEGETAAISLAMRAAARGEAYEIPFTGAMCFQHVDEVVEIFLRCLAATPDRPVVSDLTTAIDSIDDVLAAIRAVRPEAQVSAAPIHRAAPEGIDNAPLRALLGSWQAVPLAEGARRTIEAFGA